MSFNDMILLHVGLMVLAWVVLVPLGMIVSRHRDLLFSPDQKWLGLNIWYHLHRIMMIVAVMATIVAFIISFTHLEGKVVHRTMGILVFALMCIQVGSTLVRPPGGTRSDRVIWNLIHFWLARVTLVLAIVECGVGFIPFPAFGLNIAAWVAPCVTFLALLIVAEIIMTHRNPKLKIPEAATVTA